MFKRGSWPKEKCEEFSKEYLAGVPLRAMMDKYDANEVTLVIRARKLGLPKRNRYQTQWTVQGGHMRPWLFQRDQLEQMICEGVEDTEIATRLGRTRDGVRGERRKLRYPTDVSVRANLLSIFVEDGMNRELAAFILDDFHGSRIFVDRARRRWVALYREAKILDLQLWREQKIARRQQRAVTDYARLARRTAREAKIAEALSLIAEWGPLGASAAEMAAFCGMKLDTFMEFRRRHLGSMKRTIKCSSCAVEFSTFRQNSNRCTKCRSKHAASRATASSRILPVSEDWKSGLA